MFVGVYHVTVGRFTSGFGESPLKFVASGLGQRLWTQQNTLRNG